MLDGGGVVGLFLLQESGEEGGLVADLAGELCDAKDRGSVEGSAPQRLHRLALALLVDCKVACLVVVPQCGSLRVLSVIDLVEEVVGGLLRALDDGRGGTERSEVVEELLVA